MKSAFILFIMLIAIGTTYGQTATEALRLSESDPYGTARNLGAGNSMFAIGPDFSAIGLNPSGLGGFRRSEFLITLGLGTSKYSSAFLTDTQRNSTGNFGKLTLPNVGFIIYNEPRSGLWTSSNWAVGFNRVADYNREFSYAGNTLGSITDSWRENAEGLVPDDLNHFEEGLAYETGAIYDLEPDNIYETDYNLNSQYALLKRESAFQEGGKSELYLAYGADFNQKLMVGFSFALPFVNYTQTRIYREEDEALDAIPFFNELEYSSSLNTTGYGWNAKAGVTIKPIQSLHIALAVHSPTRLSLTDDFNTTLSYDFTLENHNGPITEESDLGSFQYALRTPWSVSGGVGVIAGKSGFISAHAKLTDYGSMKYDYSVRGNGNVYDQFEREVNASIRNTYDAAIQLNVGGELVLNYYRIRGGVSLLQSPFINDKSFDPSFHAGAGYRGENFYIDLGYKLTKEEDGYLPYETLDSPQPVVLNEFTHHQIAATIGFKF
jgi:hypothetical protein